MGHRMGMKEWAGVITALVQGDQIILLRKYEPDESKFCLYPTHSYYTSTKNHPEKLKAKFQKKYLPLVKEAALEQLKERDIVRLEYGFEVDQIIHLEKKDDIHKLKPVMVWSIEHVREYAETAKNGLFVWVGRIMKLNKAVLTARQAGGSPNKYKHYEDIEIDNASFILSEEVYQQKLNDLLACISKIS